MTWETIAFALIGGGAFSYAAIKFATLFKLLKNHQATENRFDDIASRVKTTLVNVFGQAAVLRKPGVGLAHSLIFWGFLVITIGTLEQFASTLYAPLHFTFVGETAYSAFALMHDLFTMFVLFGVFYAAYRRLVIKPQHLTLNRDAFLILVFTASLMLSILLMNGFSFLGHDPWWRTSMPFSNTLASILSILPFGTETFQALGTTFKWIHMLLVLGFLIYIPNSKHLHIVAAGPNTFFKNLSLERPMPLINFEDETVTQYGAAKVTDLSWKDALDYYSCTECGRCQEVCPAWNTEKALSPKRLIVDLKDNMYRNKDAILAGKYEEVSHIIDEKVTEEVIWACTSCRACEIACPVFIGHTDKIYGARRNLVMMESRFPSEVQTVFKNMETNATPWAFSAEDRANWAADIEVKKLADVGKADAVDVVLWVGCAGSYDDRNKKVLRAFVNILKKAGVSFAILGKEEQCTGDPARRIGNEYLFQTLAQTNIETLKRYDVKTIVTACPHCFNTIKNEYRAMGGFYQVYHHSQYIAQLIKQGKIRPIKERQEKITFHDSCYLGRWNGIFEEPRATIDAVPGARQVEISAHHEKSMCCGAGGGRMWMEETVGRRVNIVRTEQALATNSDTIASSCPFCLTMLTDGVKAKEMQDKVKVRDIAEIVDESLADTTI